MPTRRGLGDEGECDVFGQLMEQLHYNLLYRCVDDRVWVPTVFTKNRDRRPDAVRDNRCDHEVHEGRMQTGRRTAHAGSRLKLLSIQKGTAWKASLPAVLGKTRRTE